MKKATVIMLCGLTGSGKSTYAERVISKGYVKISIDEVMYEKYGVAGIDYPDEKYLELEKEVKSELNNQLIKLIHEGVSVILDYGFWTRKERDRYKEIIQAAGGYWQLLYFKASPETLAKRLRKRNAHKGANSFFITRSMLDDFVERFEIPHKEAEQILYQN